MGDWISRLRQASFRGVPFGALGDEDTQGRRQAVREYPGGETRTIRDLGASTPRITLRGFLIENSLAYGGGDVLVQRDLLKTAAALPGPGFLVHPTRGLLNVSLVSVNIAEQWDEQLYFALQFEFLETGSGSPILAALDTVGAVLGAADAATDVLGQLFGADADGYVASGADPGATGSVASAFSGSALGLGGGLAGVFSLSSSTTAAASLQAASGGFLAASGGLGLLTGAGLSTASAATGLVQSVSALSDPGTAMTNQSALADDFGDESG